MLKSNESSLKLVSKIAAALAIMVAASACTHEQLKQEADVASIEDTGAPTPDIETPAVDPLAESTPIPGDVGATAAPAVVRHAKKSIAKHGRKHAKKSPARSASKKKKKTKTMVATRGTVESQTPPTPPQGPTVTEDTLIPAPVAMEATETLAAPADLGPESSGGHGLIISLAILGLGALAFAGVRLRRSRGSRRLVFN